MTRRELILAAALGLAIALVMHWPLPARLGGEVPGDLGDPLFQAWQIAWGGHALVHQPLDYFQANDFWPLRNTLAFSDALVGYAPAGLIGSGPEAALVRYNVLLLFAYWLAFFGAYLLARELGASPLGATVGGAAFAYAPWRLDQIIHLNVLSSGGIPLSLFLFLRGYRRRRPGLVLAGWLVATWQLSLGFNLGLQLAYLLVVAGAAVLVLRRTRWLGRGVAAATAGGMAIFVLVGFVLSRPYVQVADDHPEARRPPEIVAEFSPPARSYLAAPEGNLLWAGATKANRDQTNWPNEHSLFPGLVTLLLAALGVVASSVPRRLRIGLAAAGIVCAILALGFSMSGVREFAPYRLLYELLPGWDSVRVPSRINTLTSLALALLAGLGATTLARFVRRRSTLAGYAIGVVLPVAVLIEGLGSTPVYEVPKPPRGAMNATAPQYHLPARDGDSIRYLLWSTRGYPELVNGYGSFWPRLKLRAASLTRSFPDRRSVAWLRALGVRTVIVHPDVARGSEWARAVTGDVEGLPLRRTVKNEFVIYALAPMHGRPAVRRE